MAPQMPPHEGQYIAKRRHLLVIPSRFLDRERVLLSKRVSKEGHQAVEPEEQRGGSQSSQI